MSPLVSIVIPCFNAAPFLEECLLSAVGQTHRELEIIVQDNQSEDASKEIANRIARADSRVRVVSTDRFLGQIENHNEALRQISAKSAYVKLLQADDFLMVDCVERMVAVAESDPSVGLVGAYTILGPATLYLDGLPYGRSVFSGREVARAFFLDGAYVTGSPTATLLRADIVRARDPFYDDVSPVEDVDVCFDLLRTWSFGFVHQVLTYTRRENESLMSSFRSFGPMITTRLVELLKFGHDFLSPEEYARCLAEAERNYYEFLAEQMLRGVSPAFWRFHDRAARTTNTPLSQRRLWLSALKVGVGLVGNPVSTAERLLRRWRADR